MRFNLGGLIVWLDCVCDLTWVARLCARLCVCTILLAILFKPLDTLKSIWV